MKREIISASEDEETTTVVYRRRMPVAMATDSLGDLVMVCSDGSFWTYAGRNGWQRLLSVPGTPAGDEERCIDLELEEEL